MCCTWLGRSAPSMCSYFMLLPSAGFAATGADCCRFTGFFNFADDDEDVFFRPKIPLRRTPMPPLDFFSDEGGALAILYVFVSISFYHSFSLIYLSCIFPLSLSSTLSVSLLSSPSSPLSLLCISPLSVLSFLSPHYPLSHIFFHTPFSLLSLLYPFSLFTILSLPSVFSLTPFFLSTSDNPLFCSLFLLQNCN
jgi:hypothetical protein